MAIFCGSSHHTHTSFKLILEKMLKIIVWLKKSITCKNENCLYVNVIFTKIFLNLGGEHRIQKLSCC